LSVRRRGAGPPGAPAERGVGRRTRDHLAPRRREQRAGRLSGVGPALPIPTSPPHVADPGLMIFALLASGPSTGGLISLLLVSAAALGVRFHRMIGILASFFLAAGVAGGALRGASGWSALLVCTASALLAPWLGPLGLRTGLALGAGLATAAVLLGT